MPGNSTAERTPCFIRSYQTDLHAAYAAFDAGHFFLSEHQIHAGRLDFFIEVRRLENGHW